MYCHITTHEGKPAYLFLDEAERVVELPTDYMRSLVLSPRRYAPGTLNRYAEKVRDLCYFLGHHTVYGQVRLDDAIANLKRPVLSEFYRSLQASGNQAATVRLAEAAVRKFTDWLNTDEAQYVHKRALYPEHASGLTPPPIMKQPRYLTHFQVIELAQTLRFEAQRLVIHFIFDTGLRISEVQRVLKQHLPDWRHYPEGQMYFPLLVRGSKGRGGQLKDRYTIISRALLSRIAKHHNTKRYQFNFDFDEDEKPALLNVFGDRWTVDAIEKLIEKARVKAKIIGASAHKLRHGTAYSILRSEHGQSLMDNLVVLQRVLGHSDIRTTEIYTHIPAPVLQKIKSNYGRQDFQNRFEESQAIFDATYLPEKRNRQFVELEVYCEFESYLIQ